MCSSGPFTEVQLRHKRELFTILTVLICSIVATAGMGIAGTAIVSVALSKTSTLKEIAAQ